MSGKPYLKPACVIHASAESLTITYRGRAYHVDTASADAARVALAAMDGTRSVDDLASRSGCEESTIEKLVQALSGTPLLLDGEGLVRPGMLTGQEAYWRLEGQLWDWRSRGQDTGSRPTTSLDRQVAKGTVSVEVVKGFCLEICHQVSNAPTEISLAIASSPSKPVRDLFMEFYEEEHAHGDMLRDALGDWLPVTGIDAAVPLPETAGLLNSYNWWAQTDVLAYAVALMRDEASPLDAPATEDDDIYLGMRQHYAIPARVVDKFQWHANLDIEMSHGSFPLEVFSQFPVVDARRYARLTKTARSIVELYDAVMSGVLAYYSDNPVESRWSAVTVKALAA